MNDAVGAALRRFLLAMADDELVAGYRATEWTGVGPLLEEDLAFSSIGLDEVGHARLYYSLLHDLTGTPVDYRARRPEEYLHARFLERRCAPRYDPGGAHAGGGDWAFALVRQHLYDRYDGERLIALHECAWTPLAAATEKVRREEKYHLQHGHTWIARLAEGGPEARGYLERALERAWPDALGLFEPVAGEALLVDAGMLAANSATMQERWLDGLAELFAPLGLRLPAEGARGGGWRVLVEPIAGGRRGEHSEEWREMWDEMTSVYRLDPAATW